MKQIYLLIALFFVLLSSNRIYSQTPDQFKYQALLRDADGNIKSNTDVTITINILQGSTTGTSIFTETYTTTTNSQGIVNLNIGSKTEGLGNLDWGNNLYFIKISVDGTVMGTSQLLSVPYALYAKNAGNGLTFDKAPQAGDILFNNGTSWTLLSKGTDGQVLRLDTGLPIWDYISETGSAIPTATFTVSKLIGSTVQAIQTDASGIVDDVDATSTLQVRWNWDDGGTFTAWSTAKTASHTYATEGTKNIVLEVKDSQDHVATTSKAIYLNNSMFTPVVITNVAYNINKTSATCGGNVLKNGESDIIARGVCWSTSQNPTIANSKTTDGTGLGIFTSTLTGFTPGSTYYIRAYATNGTTTSYGNQVTIQAILNVIFPTVTTTAATNITSTSVVTGGNVTATGGADVTAKGVCWSTNQNPTVSDSKTTDGTGTGIFQSQITDLISGTYYIRAYATNSAGTSYGSMITITNEKTVPVLTTKNITEISAMGGVTGGVISSTGGGTITEKGICWSESPNPTTANEKTTSGANSASFSAAIIKASPSTVYYVRSYAKNEIGTGYGDQKTYTTSDAQYYQSFETGITPAGWSGPFTVNNESAFDGSYSLKALTVTSEETFTYNLTTAGQISFFYRFGRSASSFDFYIDNVFIAKYPQNGSDWRQVFIPIAVGTHTLKWHFNVNDDWAGYVGDFFIDQIIITK